MGLLPGTPTIEAGTGGQEVEEQGMNEVALSPAALSLRVAQFPAMTGGSSYYSHTHINLKTQWSEW